MENNEFRSMRKDMTYAERLVSCRRIRDLDKKKMAELLDRMRGKRSLNQYAKDVGAAASSLTRIANEEANKISDELLGKLLDNMDPDCGVTFEEVIEANGLEESERLSYRHGAERFGSTAREVISYDLFRVGKSAVPVEDRISYRRGFGHTGIDFLIETNSIGNDVGLWAFRMLYIPEERTGRGTASTVHMSWIRVHEILGGIMSEFYMGTKIRKWSIVINSREEYEHLKAQISNRMGDTLIRDRISIILLNEEERYIEEEWYLPTKADTTVVFPLEPERVQEAEEEPRDDFFKEYFGGLSEAGKFQVRLMGYMQKMEQMEQRIKELEAKNKEDSE